MNPVISKLNWNAEWTKRARNDPILKIECIESTLYYKGKISCEWLNSEKRKRLHESSFCIILKKQLSWGGGGRHSSMVLSAPTILWLQVWILSTQSMYAFFNLYFWNCNKKRTEINKKGPGLAHLKNETIFRLSRWLITFVSLFSSSFPSFPARRWLHFDFRSGTTSTRRWWSTPNQAPQVMIRWWRHPR